VEQSSLNSEILARQALAAYRLEEDQLEFIRRMVFIRHGDTITYRVEMPAGSNYLLRLHIPVTQSMGTHGADYNAVSSELLWLEALCQDTDLVLPQPIRNRFGALVTEVSFPEAGEKTHCTLLRWVDGDFYRRELETEDTSFQIGKIAAKLHNHASQWRIPEGFTRPDRDISYFEKVLQGIQPAVVDGRIRTSDYEILETSVHLLMEQLHGASKDRQVFGLMHADMHKGNMLLHQGQIRLIDFSFCAFGNFLFDLAICMADMKKDLHPAFLAGYQSLRPLPAGYQPLIEGFFVGSMVGTFSYWVPDPVATVLLARKVPQIIEEYALKYNQGKRFWFDE
jgi:Ser/Thr protein kinase RdoA (MazF antagonist)